MNIRCAHTFTEKLVGLLGTGSFPDTDGLFFPGVTCIHTFFMCYAIDVLFLDKKNAVTHIAREVKPFRVVWGPAGSRSVLEMRSGAAKKEKMKIGDIIPVEES